MRGASLANMVWKLDLRAKKSIRPAVGRKAEGQYAFTSGFRKNLSNKVEESEPKCLIFFVLN